MLEQPKVKPRDSRCDPAHLVAESPDWAEVSKDVACPMCTYNLRGLIEPRCPECGYRFTWPDVLDPRRRLHPYLFEHHPERSLWSFWRTAIGTWGARRFWTSLDPVQPSRGGRLIEYWGLAVGVYVLSFVAMILAMAVAIAQESQAEQDEQAWYFVAPSESEAEYPTSITKIIRMIFVDDGYLRRGDHVLFFLPIVWPWFTLASLLIFRLTMRRARVRTIHVLRCVVYSMDTPLWLGLVVVMTFGVQIAWTAWHGWSLLELLDSPHIPWGWFALFFVLVASWRLWRAYGLYMQFDHPLATVLAAQLIVALVIGNGLLLVHLWTSPYG